MLPVSFLSTVPGAFPTPTLLPSEHMPGIIIPSPLSHSHIPLPAAAGKKVVLVGVPGAFTPTCSTKHLPGFIEKADEIKSKGVDTIACVSVCNGLLLTTPSP